MKCLLRLVQGSLTLALLAAPVLAQELEEGEVATSSGNPLYGYVAVAFLGAGILFVLCKSSRR